MRYLPLKNKRGQTSIEFIVLLTFMMFVFVSTFVVIQQRTLEVNHAVTLQKGAELMNVVKAEVDLANNAINGYKKEFLIPDYINGRDYTIKLIDNSEIEVTFGDTQTIAFLSTNVTGSISPDKGYHVILKQNNQIFIGPGRI